MSRDFRQRTLLLLLSALITACAGEAQVSTSNTELAVNESTPTKAVDPDTVIPYASNVREACETQLARSAENDSVNEIYQPKITAAAMEATNGEITEEEYKKKTANWYSIRKDSDQRLLASEVAVLKALGYTDWEMYSRYDIDGTGDLWNKNVISGERVASNKNHPHHKYTYASHWTLTVAKACKLYQN